MGGNRPADWHVLDLDKDPTPGDPDRVRNLAKNLHDFADDVSKVLRDIKGMAGEDAILTWAGKTAESFTAEFEDAPGKLKKLKKSYEMAGDALSTYWPELERAQALADKALVKGREAQGDLSSAQTRLTSADSWMDKAGKEADKYKDDKDSGKDVPKPDPDKVKAATRNANSAEKAQTAAQSDVSTAKSNLDAAKKMAEDARKMRQDAAGTAKKKLEDASDAGIQNRKWWEEVGDWVTDNWDTIVAVCKVVVAVLGVIAMIIGGPILGAIVLIAALVVLADTLNKYANGEASLWDVAFAALDCIPGMKGLTSLRGLAKGLKGMRMGLKGGLKAMGRQMKKLFTCGDPVDMATGEMVMAATDIELPGELPLVFQRSHRSGVRSGLFMGPSWTSTLDQRLSLDEAGVQFATDDGMILHYPVPVAGAGAEPPLEGPVWPLSWDGAPGGELTVHQPETGTTLRFRPLPGQPPTALPLAEISDRNGNTITFTYDAAGLPQEIAHHGGYRIAVTCENSRVVALTLASHPDRPMLMRYGYDEHGDLVEIYTSSERPQRLSYDDAHRVTGWEDRNGTWYRYEFDAAGRCSATYGMEGVLSYAFSYAEGADRTRTTTAVNSLGHATVYRFNDACQLVAETDPLGNTSVMEWDRRDQLLSATDALGHTTRMEWDASGNRTAVHLPDGTHTSARYNSLNLPVEETAQDGAVWRQEYDERGNCVSVTVPDGATTLFTHDGTGAVTSVTDATGATQRFVNNAAGLPVSETDPLGAVTRVVYDPFGRTVEATDPTDATTKLAWTVEGHLASRTAPDGATESWTYDDEDNRLSHTDAVGRVTRFSYAPFGLLASRTTADGVRHAFTHDTELRLTRVTNPHGLTWDYEFDAAGRLASETDFDGRTLTYTYDAVGRLTSRTNPLGQAISLTYDSVGSPLSKTVDGRTTTYSNDAAGRLLRAAGPDATLTYRYDRSGRITGEAVDERALRIAYDAAGRPTVRTTPSGVTTAYTYDAVGNRTTLTSSGRTFSSSYDALGRETSRRLGADGPRIGRTWDSGDRVTGQTLTAPGAARPLKAQSFTYRPDGNLTALDDQDTGRRTFDLATSGHVTAVRAADWTESYAYDAAGNQTRASWPDRMPDEEARGERSYSGNRVTGAGSVHYEYDAAGRVVLRRKTRLSRKPDVWRYGWDAEDRLTSVVTPDGTVWRYLYDAVGRRTAKQRLAAGHAAGSDPGAADLEVVEEVLFTWDGPHLVEQTTTSTGAGGPEAVTLTWDRDGVRPLAQTERRVSADAPQEVIDERFFAIVTDLVGTPTELVSESGDIAWHGDATLWGITAWNDEAAAYTPLRFPGQYFDPETQLHYNYFRHYDPATALYISPDPLGMDAGPNPRAYVLNPLGWIDYLGLLTCRQNARRLRRNMRREGRGPARGEAAAHLVPSGGTHGHWAPGVRSRALLDRYGVNINDAANGIPLGHPSPHNYTHRGPFLTRLNDRLHAVEADRLARGFGDRAIRTELRRELRSIGREVSSELATGQPGRGAFWTVP
ncbi:hypothetical protein GCM10009837_49240 [Streptomyces durmitorensis]|uniref:DUF6531 domain-containing protein n=1 Tax=Streptomyces durmitorensis TaxID=319947 RepID=A0ABY4PXT4_9ACTN|nr:DUF6531 domain-containing protein [Streptomyces durmitorensis]UQT58034.1 DUF6531 domain-containing protein [Streptomyces durmitorensis]